jgi:hypothetical protein
MKYVIPFFCLVLVAACKPEVSADIYALDVIEVAETGESIEFPVRMGLPIQSEDNCEEDKSKMLPALIKFGTGVKFISCEVLDGEMHDLLIVEMIGEMVRASDSGVPAIGGMFGVAVTQLDDGSLVIDFLKTKNVDEAVSEIDKNYQFQTVELDDIELRVSLNNDLINTIKYEIGGSFVNNNPVDSPQIFELPRRGKIEVVPSNVRSQSFVITGKARFARLIVN